jgi:hypothetical protein
MVTGLGLGAGSESIAVGVATWGEPAGVGGLLTFAVTGGDSGALLHAATSTLSTATSNRRCINIWTSGEL